ncbi:mitochondrial 2-methylisocitrate lyase [Cryomyces antarcticus]|uniref:methylisocitrate lyase n=1 Tax=Cryomyces antarcticus TaxID=329879 RepID=A0ABR0K0R5_9PEZI|nr:mitochondrial 2-methylisocitrate lyase [Cryomyces antarcticus]
MGQGFTEEALKSFIWDLAKHGFVLQLISLAGLHSTATITNELSSAFATDGMLAYVNLVQRREKELGCDVLTHQKWSGAGYIDGILGAIQSGSSGSKSMGEGNTETGTFTSSHDKRDGGGDAGGGGKGGKGGGNAGGRDVEMMLLPWTGAMVAAGVGVGVLLSAFG